MMGKWGKAPIGKGLVYDPDNHGVLCLVGGSLLRLHLGAEGCGASVGALLPTGARALEAAPVPDNQGVRRHQWIPCRQHSQLKQQARGKTSSAAERQRLLTALSGCSFQQAPRH